VHLRLGDLYNALKDANAALRLKPKYASAHSTRGSVYLERGSYDIALAEYSNAAAIERKRTYFDNCALAHMWREELDEALKM